MSNSSLFLVPSDFFQMSYKLELKFKRLLVLESLYGLAAMFIQKYIPNQLRLIIIGFLVYIFIIFIFCYILITICIQVLNNDEYITSLNYIDQTIEKRQLNLQFKDIDKNISDNKLNKKNQISLLDMQKKHLMKNLINITKNRQQMVGEISKFNEVYIPMYKNNLLVNTFAYLTIAPILLIKKLVKILSIL